MKTAWMLCLAGALAWADVSYTNTTQITGGALVGMASLPIIGGKIKEALQPQISETFLKGDRLMNRSADSADIIDLGAETLTRIDFKNRKYSVMTFAEFEAQMEKAMAEVEKRKSGRNNKEEPVEMQLDIDVQETGRSATIDGYDCREVILLTKMTGTDPQTGQSAEFALRNAMWIAKDVSGQKEMADFWTRMVEKMKFNPKALPMDVLPGFGPGMSELQKKARLLEGTPIVTTALVGAPQAMRVEEPIPESTEALRRADQESLNRIKSSGPSGKQVAGEAAASAIGSAIPGLGGIGGFGRKKKEPSAAAPSPAAAPAEAGVTMKMRMTEYGFSTAPVDAGVFAIPEGFTKTAAK
jgi:hypothetical protein